MQVNVIYLSDGSFDYETNMAGIGVKNLYTQESYSTCIAASGSQEAEEFALIEAINHAITHGYRNCVFVYDNIAINTDAYKTFFKKMFDSLQFIWFKREYLNEVDRLAAMVHPSKKGSHILLDQLIEMIPSLKKEELMAMFMPYTRGEVYGFLCSLSGAAPMYKNLPKGRHHFNTEVLSLLTQFGSKTLKEPLVERFGQQKIRKYIWLEEFLHAIGFNPAFKDDAKRECRGVNAA